MKLFTAFHKVKKKTIRLLTYNRIYQKKLNEKINEYSELPIQEYSDMPIGKNIQLYWWYGDNNGDKLLNLGDYLSSIVVKHYAPTSGGSDTQKTVYGIGSILGFRVQDAVVWGSGLLDTSVTYAAKVKLSDFDIRAVRGPKTRRVLLKLGKKCPKVYGDPAILLPDIYTPEDKTKIYDAVIIPHFAVPLDIPDNYPGIKTLNILTTDYKCFVDQIVKSKVVISGSLHGIILAEAYGVPAILVDQNNRDLFKYKDYYFGTGRHIVKVAKSVEQALHMKPMPLPNLKKQRERLIAAFPYDIWKQK